MSFNRINNIVGWIVCLIACTVYVVDYGTYWEPLGYR